MAYTFDAIQKASASIKSTPIHGKDYAEVPQRVKAFRQVCPMGEITTEILSITDGMVIIKATVSDETGKVLGTGMAYEKETSSQINKTSFIENCETSAVGRALGFCGFGIDTSIASKEEVENAIHQQSAPAKKGTEAKVTSKPAPTPAPTETFSATDTDDFRKVEAVGELEAMGVDIADLMFKFGYHNVDECPLQRLENAVALKKERMSKGA